MKKNPGVSVEVCAYSFISCLAADHAGASRVELCASPWEGGTTPSAGLVSHVLSQTNMEVHAMLRPRGEISAMTPMKKIRWKRKPLP